MILTATEKFVALASGILMLLGMIMGAKGKWDQTNYMLDELKRGFAAFITEHEKDIARIDRRVDNTDQRMSDHIGRHRR